MWHRPPLCGQLRFGSLGPKGNGSIVSHLPGLIGQSISVLTREPIGVTLDLKCCIPSVSGLGRSSTKAMPCKCNENRVTFFFQHSSGTQVPCQSYCNDTVAKHNGRIVSHLCNLIGQSISVVTTESRPFLSTQFGAQFKDQATLII